MAIAMELEVENRFFHWPLEFAEVFATGGFDVVLSNPPWERVKLQEKEFFAVHDIRIANAKNKTERRRLIQELPVTNPDLYSTYTRAVRAASAASTIVRHGGRYPLAGRGDINTYALFAELGASVVNPLGRAGLILPTGIATDDTTRFLFGALVQSGRVTDLLGFENEELIFPAVHHGMTFCELTIGGAARTVPSTRITFRVRRYQQLHEIDRFYHLRPSDFVLVNPNTGTSPVCRSNADAELTKAVYRRMPILLFEGRNGEPEQNPWRISFGTMFHMSNDSALFRDTDWLKRESFQLEGNWFRDQQSKYLPLYEAKMLHQFDHRFSTYEGATQKQLNVGILPQPSLVQKQDPSYVVQPRYWIAQPAVEEAMPRVPHIVARALEKGSDAAVRTALARWAAGYFLNRGESGAADRILGASGFSVRSSRKADAVRASASALERDFPLLTQDVSAIGATLESPVRLAWALVDRYSPKWLLGWRDITNAGNERTLLMSVLPKTAVGNNFPLIFMPSMPVEKRLSLLWLANSFVVDYVCRQKIAGTHINYFYLKQLPFPKPECLGQSAAFIGEESLSHWVLARVLELVLVSYDIKAIGDELEVQHELYAWDEDRRFEIRCELDAAAFHLYLPSDDRGKWIAGRSESPKELAVLESNFATPRDAVAHIMDTFSIVRASDEDKFQCYRTKQRILATFDDMFEAQRSHRPYVSALTAVAYGRCRPARLAANDEGAIAGIPGHRCPGDGLGENAGRTTTIPSVANTLLVYTGIPG
jgi:hypothetical protein